MLELFFKYPKVVSRLRGGGLGGEMDRIAAYLAEFDYKRASAKIYLGRLGRFQRFCVALQSNNADSSGGDRSVCW